MYTSIGMFALAGLFVAPAAREAATWHLRYDLAHRQGQMEGKPLAVVIGSGHRGFDGLSSSGKLPEQARRLLAKHYIPVYVDASLPAGRKLARDFGIKRTGLVISDSGGELQAFFHDGRLDDDVLTRKLQRYADPARVAQTTEQVYTERYSYYPAQTPAAYQPFVPSAGLQPYYGGFSGGGCRS
jgi:hypothetical protein